MGLDRENAVLDVRPESAERMRHYEALRAGGPRLVSSDPRNPGIDE